MKNGVVIDAVIWQHAGDQLVLRDAALVEDEIDEELLANEDLPGSVLSTLRRRLEWREPLVPVDAIDFMEVRT